MGWKDNKIIVALSKWVNNPQDRRWVGRIAKGLWIACIGGILSIAILFLVLTYSDLPSFEELENPQYDLASIIYDAEENPFGKYYIENREFIHYKDLSANIKNALLSVEDARYFSHSGIDFQALLRVMFKSVILQQESGGGGSTITQQLAKLLFDRESLANKSTIQRAFSIATIKFKEWITAVKLEKSYTKEEIMAMYLNKFEFINGAHGVQSAAQIYFNKNQDALEIEEAAMLVGMLKNPARFNPVRFNERAVGRRNVVLNQMYDHDKINKSQRDSLKLKPLSMEGFKKSSQSDGLAPYFRSELTKWLKSLLSQKDYLKPDGSSYDIYRDGLKIFTTIDIRYQEKAEKAVTAHLAKLQKRYWQVWKRLDPLTYDATEFQKSLREEAVQRRIRDTDIYIELFEQSFSSLEETTQTNYGVTLNEPTIRRLVSDPVYLDQIDSNVRDKFKKLMNSVLWSTIENTWQKFEEKINRLFEEKVQAQVFAYNEDGFEIKEMTRRDSVIYHLQHLQAGVLSLDPKTGEIKAWVGGPDHRYFKFDHVNMRRQVGSTIKPFVYASAISVLGMSPCQEFQDIQYTIAPGDADFKVDAPWSPSNSNGLFTQTMYNLYQGLLYSKNSITVRIVKEMGTMTPVRDLLHNAGIDKYERINNERLVVPDVPSICLGSVDLSLMEMVGAYTTFANDGIYSQPNFIRRIEDKNGKIIYQGSTIQRRAINSLYNAVMVDMLKNNVASGFSLSIKSEVGGKTGTTNDYADGWFMGITPNLVTGVWTGGDEKWVRFLTLDDGQGFVMARPIFQEYMKALEADEELNFDTQAKFKTPPPGFIEMTDCSRYKSGKPEEESESNLQRKIDLDVFDDDDLELELEEFDPIDTSFQQLNLNK